MGEEREQRVIISEDDPLFNVNLGKWPRLVVQSLMDRNLTFEETADILIRTDDLFFSRNDWDDFQEKYKIFGVNVDANNIWDDYGQELCLALGTFELEYLNNDQISSSSIHGPKGWLDWDGTIGCNCYHIGKWPSVRAVKAEWERIAKVWPFLRLRCQLLEGDLVFDGVDKPLVEYVIADGNVVVTYPQKVLPSGNVGCTGTPFKMIPTELVQRAYDVVKARLSK